MNVRDIGLGLVFAGIILMVGYGAYAIMQETDMPMAIKLGLIGIFIGILILLISLIMERLKEVEK